MKAVVRGPGPSDAAHAARVPTRGTSSVTAASTVAAILTSIVPGSSTVAVPAVAVSVLVIAARRR
jgi:hypothetical protein